MEEALDLSFDRLPMMMMMMICVCVLIYVCVCVFQARDQKRLESSKMWCWRRMKKISWNDPLRNEEVLQRVKGDRNILHAVKKKVG